MTCDTIVVGGGVIGLSIADRLAASGKSVTLFDASEPGHGTSWAGSGSLQLIVPDLAPPLIRPLAARSTSLWPAFGRELEERTRMDIELRNSGLLRIALGDEDTSVVERTAAYLRERDVRVEKLTGKEARERFPAISDRVSCAFYEPKLMQVRPPRLLHALNASVVSRGVAVRANQPVTNLIVEGGAVIGVQVGSEKFHAKDIVLAAGPHAGELARRSLGLDLPIRPVRGQIALLESYGLGDGPLLLGMDAHYLIPRADGRVLAGSTFERVGFDKNVSALGIHDILAGAIRLVPSLASAKIAASWAGLRPESPDRLPYLGRVAGLDGLMVAAGHYRDGLLLAPVTVEIVCNALLGKPQEIDITPFNPTRKPAEWMA